MNTLLIQTTGEPAEDEKITELIDALENAELCTKRLVTQVETDDDHVAALLAQFGTLVDFSPKNGGG